MATIDVIKDVLNDKLDIEPEKVNEDSSLESLGLDSLDLVELVCELEDRLDIDFGDPDNLTNIGDVVKHIESL